MFISLLKKACRFFSAGFLRYFSFLFSTACVIVLDKKQIYMKLEVDGMNEARNATSVICSAYDSFFEAEKKIADFLIEHKAEAAGMTVGELARASQTSDATVSRFCRRCGFKGFQDLKLALTRELLEEAQVQESIV